jgi:hypothetical protein
MKNNNSTINTTPNPLVNDTAASSHGTDFLSNPKKLDKAKLSKHQRKESSNTNTASNSQIVHTANNHNEILDNEQRHSGVDLLQHVPDSHPLKKLAISIANVTDLPVNTVFLMGLAIFSSVSCRRYMVNHQYGGSVPIGLYAVAEQPSGTGKSWCLSIFQKAFFKAYTAKIEAYKQELQKLKAIPKENLTDEEKKRLNELKPIPPLFTTNATPEALEQYINQTNGFFSAISSEQGLFNSLLGFSYGDNKKANNNDLVLNGFDGGYINSMRIGREGYNGSVIGGIALFAQQGSIEKVLNVSEGTGLSERFLMLAEPHNLGKRDRTKSKVIVDSLLEIYNEIATQMISDIFDNPEKELQQLNISSFGHSLIGQYLNIIEPHLIDGGKFSHAFLRGAAGKLDIQIMKIAANLYLLDGGSYSHEIPEHHVRSAIGIANELFHANIELCHHKGVMGIKAEFMAILRMFETSNKPLTERQITTSRCRVSPFKEFTGNKYEAIRKTLMEMVSEGILKIITDETEKTMYLLAQ